MAAQENAIYERVLSAVELYGYGRSLAAAVLWFARVDVLIPMVQSHRAMLESISAAYERLADQNEARLEELGEIRRLIMETRHEHE